MKKYLFAEIFVNWYGISNILKNKKIVLNLGMKIFSISQNNNSNLYVQEIR